MNEKDPAMASMAESFRLGLRAGSIGYGQYGNDMVFKLVVGHAAFRNREVCHPHPGST